MKKRLAALWADDFVRHTGIMVVGLQLVNVLNLAFHLIMVRVLSYAEYGMLNALVILSFYFCQFTPPFQPALTRFIARFLARGETGKARWTYHRGLLDLGLLSLLLVALAAVFAGPLAAWQQIPGPGWMVAAGVLIAVNIMLSAPLSYLQGAQLFTPFAVINALSALVKLLVGAGLLLAGLRVGAGMAGFIATPLFIIITGGIFLHLRFRQAGEVAAEKTSMAPIYRYYLPTGLVLVSFTVLTNMDVTLVKRFFSPLEAGYYSVAQMVGKIILFLPWAVSMVVFPKATDAEARARNSFPLLLKGLLLTAVLGGGGFLICLASPSLVLSLLTGKTDPEAVSLVIPFASAMTIYALLWLVVFYNLSIHNLRFPPLLPAGAAAQSAAICLHHPSLNAILHIMNVTGAILLAATLLLSRNRKTMAEFDREVI